FVAGNKRIIGVGARLGFHAAAMPGVSDDEIRAYQKKELDFFIEQGVPRNFLNTAYNTPNNDMWYPVYAELFFSNIVTHIDIAGDVVSLDVFCTKENCNEFSTAPIWLQKVAA